MFGSISGISRSASLPDLRNSEESRSGEADSNQPVQLSGRISVCLGLALSSPELRSVMAKDSDCGLDHRLGLVAAEIVARKNEAETKDAGGATSEVLSALQAEIAQLERIWLNLLKNKD